ncbi:MAG: type II secretion system protein GspN [Deltaproteobacteria bacterium]|nr:type II secretion system protein GspN [Deltaproteobacteria bacterium]
MKGNHGGFSILYVLYGLFLFCLLLLIFFPYGRLAESLIHRFSEERKITMRYDHFDFHLPLRCSFQPVEILLPNGDGQIPIYRGNLLSLRVSPWSLFRGRVRADFQGKGYGGTLSGSVRIRRPFSSGAGKYFLQVAQLRIEDVLSPFYLRDFKIDGRLSGEGTIRVPEEGRYLKATGKITASLKNGSVRNILIQGLDLPDFNFQAIEVKTDLREGVLRIRKCHVASDILLAEIDGEVRLDARDIRESPLNLTAHLKAQADDPINLKGVARFFHKTPDSKGYYSFRIQGTFRNPQLL